MYLACDIIYERDMKYYCYINLMIGGVNTLKIEEAPGCNNYCRLEDTAFQYYTVMLL